MIDTRDLFKTAHAHAARRRAEGSDCYRMDFSNALRWAWADAKRAAAYEAHMAAQATHPKTAEIAAVETAILSEESRSFMNFAEVARLRSQLTELRAAA
ncbi:MAG: hypothetical protein AAF250_16225 [Pseudomonadota bacterium]